MSLAQLQSKVKNLFQVATLNKHTDNGAVNVTTTYGRTVEAKQKFPYGFITKAKKGTVTILCAGGNLDGLQVYPVESTEGSPSLNDGDVAIYTAGGSIVICREDGTLELNGKQNGALIKVDELVTQLNKNTQILESMLAVFRSVPPIVEPGNGAPSALNAALSGATTGMSPGDYSNIKSDKVYHGTGNA